MVEPRAESPAPIPGSITTSDQVETRLGALEFFDGLPTAATADLLHEHLAFIRGVESFLNGIPAASLESLRRGMVDLGAVTSHQCVIFDQ
jgi:hypothetical protein